MVYILMYWCDMKTIPITSHRTPGPRSHSDTATRKPVAPHAPNCTLIHVSTNAPQTPRRRRSLKALQNTEISLRLLHLPENGGESAERRLQNRRLLAPKPPLERATAASHRCARWSGRGPGRHRCRRSAHRRAPRVAARSPGPSAAGLQTPGTR